MDRPGAVHRREAHLREPRRRHVLPLAASLAIRAAVAAKVNITYKILYNDAVAMTGGQPVDGPLDRADDRAAGGGRRRDARSSSSPTSRDKYPTAPASPTASRCTTATSWTRAARAARERRRIGAGLRPDLRGREAPPPQARQDFADPAKRVVINELVCEGCGDCGVQVELRVGRPLETEFGRKRTIDQSSCNKDYSCVNGFCPSFVTVEGGQLQKRQATAARQHSEPAASRRCRRCDARPYGILVTGIGGTGVVTIGRCSAWPRISKARAHRCST